MTVAAIPWRPAWVGGAFTAVVFLLAAYGIGIYFEIAGPTTALGFAGSFVVILFLAYFLSMVFLYGAEVTKAYSDRLAATEGAGSQPTSVHRPPSGGGGATGRHPPGGLPGLRRGADRRVAPKSSLTSVN